MYGESDQDNSLVDEVDTAIAQAMAEYEQLVKQGHPFSREEFLAKHSAIADRLASCLEAVDFLYRLLPEPSTSQWPDPHLQRPDSIVGDFRIVRPIGRGGMGQVYEAHQISLNRRVALKFLGGASALDERAIQRFRNEALVAATLLHPNIVPVYSVGELDHVPYIAMQLIDGFSLADVMAFMRRERDLSSEADRTQQAVAVGTATWGASSSKVKFLADLSAFRRQPRDYFQRVVGWMLQAANGLSHAHDAGIVHRDIKPENVLVDGNGNVWIADFGLAKLPESNLTETADLLGTLRYMSPEQAAGKGLLLDGRTDVYSLGATLYELLTLCPVFTADDRSSLLQKVLHDEPRSPRQIEKDLPLDLEIILQKAMAKEAHDRYATAADFAADLERYLSDQPILASPTSTWRRVEKWIKRNRVAVGFTLVTFAFCMTVGLFALSIGMVLLRNQRDRLGLALEREGNSLRLANRANQFAMESLASEREARTIERQVAYRQAVALAHSLWKSGKVENAEEILQDCPERLREWEWGFVLQLCRRECNSIAMELESPRQLECTARGEVIVLGTDGAKKWSIPSGEFLEAWKVPSDPNSVTQLVPGGQRWISYPRKRAQESNEIRWFDGLSGNLLGAIPTKGIISSLSMSADGEAWATVSSDGYRIGKTISSTDYRDVRHVLSGRIAFSRDGSLFATKATEGRDRKWFELANVDSHLGIAMTEQGEFITRIDDIMIAGTDLDLLAFSPDNRYLASSIFQGDIKVWEVSSGKLHCKLDARLGDQGDLAFTPDGRWLATSDHTDEAIRIWDVQTGRPIKQFAPVVLESRRFIFPTTDRFSSPC